MRRGGALLLCLLALAAAPAAAQGVVTSAAPGQVDVTVYRNPNRSPGGSLDPEWLNGYALITETRRVSLPAGESELRFEGVAGGMIPQSAIVTGFPDGIVERNRDAYLLSPETLLDRSLGRRVHIRRTSRATGKVIEEEAVIRSGADGAVVLQTPAGIEALRCTGLPEALVYPGVPQGLSAKPTLSVRVRSGASLEADVTLSYLATGFDWQANYIAELSPDGRRADLFAWLTLASSDETSFRDADTQAVAGRLNREEVEIPPAEGGALQLRCWPWSRTSDMPVEVVDDDQVSLTGTTTVETMLNDLPQVIPKGAEITVTGSRIATQEELGDVKLYRLPEPVTIASNSQKQVAFLEKAGVAVEIVYRRRVDPRYDEGEEVTGRVLVTRNRTEEGLGVPLPGGALQLFAKAGGRPILLGQGNVRDRAVGEEVEIRLGPADGVRTSIVETEESGDWEHYRLTVTNDHPEPVRFEADFAIGEDVRFRPKARLSRRDGRPLWAVTVPANGTATLTYRVKDGEV